MQNLLTVRYLFDTTPPRPTQLNPTQIRSAPYYDISRIRLRIIEIYNGIDNNSFQTENEFVKAALRGGGQADCLSHISYNLLSIWHYYKEMLYSDAEGIIIIHTLHIFESI